MSSIFGWIKDRLTCLLKGHRFERARVYYPPAKTVQSGYCCERCAKTQIMLKRWDEVVDDE